MNCILCNSYNHLQRCVKLKVKHKKKYLECVNFVSKTLYISGTAQQPKLFVGMVLILIFGEVLGLYGLIIALILNTAH